MTLDDSGWILTKSDFWRREVGECVVRQDELTVFLISRRRHSETSTFIKEALYSE